MPAEIVTPLRDVPGMRASTCARPMTIPSRIPTASSPSRPRSPRRARRHASHSAAAITSVANNSAPVTTSRRRASPRIRCRAANPTTTIGSVPAATSRPARESACARGRPERIPASVPRASRTMSCRRATQTAASVPHWITAE